MNRLPLVVQMVICVCAITILLHMEKLERTLCLKQVMGIKHVVVNTWHDVDIQNIMSRIISSNNGEYKRRIKE